MSLGVFCFTSPRCAWAISVHERQCTVKHIFSILDQCLAARVNMAGRLLGTTRSGHHLQSKTRGTVTLGGASGAPAEILLNMREGTISEMRVSRTTLPRTMKVKRLRVVTRVRAATVRKMLRELRRDAKQATPHPADATDVETIRSMLWELQRLLNNRKGSVSATYKKNAEANTRAHDLNQKTMQALGTLAEEYEVFEETMKKVTLDTEEGDMLYAVASEVGEEDRLQDELEYTGEGMVTASKEFTNCWALHNAACATVDNTGQS